MNANLTVDTELVAKLVLRTIGQQLRQAADELAPLTRAEKLALFHALGDEIAATARKPNEGDQQ